MESPRRTICYDAQQKLQLSNEHHHWEQTVPTSALTTLNERLDRKEKTEEYLRQELRAREATIRILQEQHIAEMDAMILRQAREKKELVERNKQLKNDVRVMKRFNTILKEVLDTKELQAMEVINKRPQEQ
jgi:hypothetical protein